MDAVIRPLARPPARARALPALLPQVLPLLPGRTSSAVAAALDMLEAAIGGGAFQPMLGLTLTDNGAKFLDWGSLKRSYLPGRATRRGACCWDLRQSQQKGGCKLDYVAHRRRKQPIDTQHLGHTITE